MTSSFKGGRGKKAPYETMMIRIPVPIKGYVEELANKFRVRVSTQALFEDTPEEFVEKILADLKQTLDEYDFQFLMATADRAQIKRLKARIRRLEAENAELQERADHQGGAT